MEQLMVKTGLPSQEAKIELHRQLHPENIEWFIEDQAFLVWFDDLSDSILQIENEW
jgi:hypothetical protein